MAVKHELLAHRTKGLVVSMPKNTAELSRTDWQSESLFLATEHLTCVRNTAVVSFLIYSSFSIAFPYFILWKETQTKL